MDRPNAHSSRTSCLRDTALARQSPDEFRPPRLSDDRFQELKAERVYIGRYGHTPGHSIHFHVIPIYRWVEALFWQDERYRVLNTFAEGPGETGTDGAELTFFVWREFCERAVPPPIQGPSVAEVIEHLRDAFRPGPRG